MLQYSFYPVYEPAPVPREFSWRPATAPIAVEASGTDFAIARMLELNAPMYLVCADEFSTLVAPDGDGWNSSVGGDAYETQHPTLIGALIDAVDVLDEYIDDKYDGTPE